MKYCGIIGFGITEEQTVDGVTNGVWEDKIIERQYYGDVLRFSNRRQGASKVNDDIDISNQLSILADPFAYENFQNILYVTWMNAKWKVSTVTVDYPRITLDIGGVYNGEQA